MAECVPNRKLIAELMDEGGEAPRGRAPRSPTSSTSAPSSTCRWASPRRIRPATRTRSTSPTARARTSGRVEGQEIVDFHNGFGCMVQGHAHPVIVEAIQKRAPLGTQFALPTEDSIIMAENLAGAFKLPQVALRQLGLRGHDGRHPRGARASPVVRPIVKMFGSYHGHHDYVMVSIGALDYGKIGPRDDYASLTLRRRHPAELDRPHRRGAVQRHREHHQAHRAHGRRGQPAGLRHHGSRHDEPRRRAARAGLPRGQSARSPRSTASS